MQRRLELIQLAKETDPDSLSNVLRLKNFELPPLSPGKVRVQVAYAGINFADLLVAKGEYQEKPRLPAVLGSEGSGVVVQSSDTSNLPVGTRVIVIAPGTFSTLVDVDATQVFPIGPRFPLDLAGGFGVAAGTAHLGLVDRAQCQVGDLVVVTGASGGTGMYACLIAKALGCKVVATARGAAKAAFVRSLLGPEDHVVDLLGGVEDAQGTEGGAGSRGGGGGGGGSGKLKELVATVLRVSKGLGAQVVYDTVGGDELFRALLSCAVWKCRLVIVGFASSNSNSSNLNSLNSAEAKRGKEGSGGKGGGLASRREEKEHGQVKVFPQRIPANVLLVKNSSAVGLYWGRYFEKEYPTVRRSMEELVRMVETGQIDVTKTIAAPSSPPGPLPSPSLSSSRDPRHPQHSVLTSATNRTQQQHEQRVCFPLEEGAHALSALASGKTLGKVLLNCSGNVSTASRL